MRQEGAYRFLISKMAAKYPYLQNIFLPFDNPLYPEGRPASCHHASSFSAPRPAFQTDYPCLPQNTQLRYFEWRFSGCRLKVRRQNRSCEWFQTGTTAFANRFRLSATATS